MMSNDSFNAFMQERRRVAQAFVNGDPAPLRAISTTADPASFFGPAGGVKQGADDVLAVNVQGARQFRPGGRTEIEVLHQGCAGDLGYWTGLQRATAIMESKSQPVEMTLRVTEIFRREEGAWRLVHRHADSLDQPDDRG